MNINATAGITRSRIIGTGHYVSDEVLTNADLEKILDTSDEWIRTRTGIRERRITNGDMTTSDMAASALQKAIDMSGIKPDNLDAIICGTVTPDRHLPAAAAYIQNKLGISNYCPSFDIAAACAGFIYGIMLADSMIKSGQAKTVGITGVEHLSRILNYTDRNTCVLFGDGAGAVVLTAESEDRGILSTHTFTDGSLTELLTIKAGGAALPASEKTVRERQHLVEMDGREVFKHAVKYLSQAAKTALSTNNFTADDVDVVVAHQANMRILSGVSDRVKIPLERFVLNIEKYGNTSSASIPIALDEAVRSERIKKNDIILMIALGGGISWGSSLIRW